MEKQLLVFRLLKKPAVLIALFAVAGAALIIFSHAATPLFNSIEPENGSSTGNASSGFDQAASGGAFMQFGAKMYSPVEPFPFVMMSELYHDGAGAAQQFRDLGIANGFTFHDHLTTDERNLIVNNKLPFMYYAVPHNISFPAGCLYGADTAAPTVLKDITAQTNTQTNWLFGLQEFDQGGGCWTQANGGRPQPVTDRKASYDAWMNYYKNTLGYNYIFNQTAAQRGYQHSATCVYAFCPQYAYDMGNDLVLLERVIDEVSGLTPGIAMLRGASKQHEDKPWGIEFSTWRYWTNSPTEYDASGKLTGGWSPSWFKRNWYMAFMAGSNVNFGEAADMNTGGQNGGLNPFGKELQQFGNYALKRHGDRGTPFVPMALVQDHYSGFEPKFGQYIQADYSWYSQLPYANGDKMLSNLMAMIYPNYNSHGTLVAGGPQSVDEYRRRLANGEDPRPWEPMGTTRYGETFDVITNQSSLATLKKYKVVLLSLGQPVSDTFRAVLTQYAQGGGVVVMNNKEMTSADASLGGVTLSANSGTSTASNWTADNSNTTENSYTFTRATPTTATVIAKTGDGSPLITKNTVGSGEVYVTTADYLSDTARTKTLTAGQKLLDSLSGRFAMAQITGPAVDYLINTSGNKILVTIVNTGGSTWNGQVTYSSASGSVKEYIGDAAVTSSVVNGKVVANASVAPYDVKVFALEK